MIDECPVQLECLLRQILPLGSHHLFLGEVVALHIKEEVQKQDGAIDIAAALPLVYCPGAREYWSLGKRLGWHGFTKGRI